MSGDALPPVFRRRAPAAAPDARHPDRVGDDLVDALLEAPRVRRLCAALAGVDALFWPWEVPADPVAQLAGAVATADLDGVASRVDPRVLLEGLQDAVLHAWPWQEPDEVDQVLARPGVAAVLAPVAAAVAAAPASRWWSAPVVPAGQHHVRWLNEHPALPDAEVPHVMHAGRVSAAVQDWARQSRAEEQRATHDRPADPTAMVSAHWWSAPCLSGLVSTTGTIPASPGRAGGVGDVVGLHLVEDHDGWPAAEVRAVQLRPGARVYEVDGPGAWAALVAAHPLEVTASRRHDWWRYTGWAGTWVIPDYASVAASWDGVHVSVTGYLTTAGRALHLPGRPEARTVLAGWDPDATWWLTDAVTGYGPPAVVRLDD